MKDFIEILIIMIVSGLSFSFGFWLGENSKEKDAVKAKVAEYYLDDNGDKQFRFKEIGK